MTEHFKSESKKLCLQWYTMYSDWTERKNNFVMSDNKFKKVETVSEHNQENI